jgi:hypothetical protein
MIRGKVRGGEEYRIREDGKGMEEERRRSGEK